MSAMQAPVNGVAFAWQMPDANSPGTASRKGVMSVAMRNGAITPEIETIAALRVLELKWSSRKVSPTTEWLRRDPAMRPPFAEAVTIQHRVAMRGAPKQAAEGAFEGPLSYAYHFYAGYWGKCWRTGLASSASGTCRAGSTMPS